MLTQERLKEILHYNPETGEFKRLLGKFKNGKVGHINDFGYVCIYAHDKVYKAHRLAFLFMTGRFPLFDVDHIDGNPSNNAWNNLRDVETVVNCQNRRKQQKNSTCKTLGVSFRNGKYTAQISVNKKQIYLGTFLTSAEAANAYLVAKREYHQGCTI